MHLVADAFPTLHSCSTGSFASGECFGGVSINASGRILAAISSTQLHLFGTPPTATHWASVCVPRTLQEESPCQFVLWHPQLPNELVVISSHRIFFYEVDLDSHQGHLQQSTFGNKDTPTCSPLLPQPGASRVCLGGELPIEAGRATSATHAGPHAFLVSTTAGVIFVVSWTKQEVIHQWSLTSFRSQTQSLTLLDVNTSPESHSLRMNASQSFISQQPVGREVHPTDSVVAPIPGSDTVSWSKSMQLRHSGPIVVAPGRVKRVNAEAEQQRSSSSFSVVPSMLGSSSRVLMDVHGRSELERLTGTFLSACCNPHARILAFVLSGGSILVTHPADGSSVCSFSAPLHGCLYDMPNVAMVSINATHSLLAVAYRDGSLSCFAFDSATLALKSDAVWRVPAAQESAKLDSVSVLQWSPCHHEEVLCIGTYEGGLSLYHVNGTCLLRSRRSVTDNTISSTPGFLGSYTVKGCLHACWSPRGTRIVLVEPSSQQVASYALGQVITSPFQCSSREDFGHVAVLYDHQLQLCRGTAREGGKLEMVTPTTYLSTSCSSLRFGAISPSGQYVMCSGTIGCTVLDRRTHRWCSSDASEVFSCVAHPTWLMEEVMALPIYTHTTLQCEIVLLRPASPSPRQHISRLPMDAKPMLLGSSPGNHPREAFFSVVNVDQRLRMYRVTMDQRRAHCVVVPLQSVTLLGNLRNPLSAIPLGRCREQERPWMLLHSSVDHGLKLASWGPPKEEIPDRPPGDPEATVIPLVPFGHDGTPMVLQVWQDHLHPTKDLCFIVHEHAGLYFYHVIPTKEGGTSPDATFMIERTMIAATEGDMTALGIEAANGCVMIAEMRSDAPAQRRSRSSSPMHLRSVLYAHAILTSVVQQNIAGDSPNAHSVRRASLVTQWSCDPGLCFWLEQLRQRGTFVQTVDLCLHTILNDWPSSGQHSGQRLHALQWMLSMLRNYPEFHEVVVGCLRKIETKKSVMLLDLLGSPMNVYQECIAHYQFREAAHLVRLIMMGNLRWTMIEGSEDPQGPVASLQQASDCVVDLFGRSLSHGDYDGANNLLRFLALLHHEMELPGGTSAYGTQPPLIVRLLPQWLRGPSTSRPTLADHPSLRVDLPTVSPTTRNHSAFESIQGPQPTLVNESASAVVEGSPTCEMLRLFELHPELPRSLVAEGLRLLVNGLLGELDDFLRTFSCSPAHFVNVHLSDFDSKMQVDLEESSATFNTFLSGLHNQLGIPLPHHTIGARGVKQLQGYQVALDEGDATGEVMSDWTQAQCILYSNANVLQLTEKWRVMLAGHPLHELALDLLLMRKSNVMNAIHRLDDGGTTEGCDASLMRVIISGLSSVPGLHAYHKLLTTSYQQVDAARDAQR